MVQVNSRVLLSKDQAIQLLLRDIEKQGNPQWRGPNGKPARSPEEALIELLRKGTIEAGVSPNGELQFRLTAPKT
jgi:hypothetical protein